MDLQIPLDHRAQVEAFQRKHRIGLLTLLFTDIVGSTQLKQQLGDREGVALIQRHHALVREILSRFKEAEEISTAGDSFFLVFAKPSEAAKFALLLQMRLGAMTKESGQAVLDRIGIHFGEVVIEDAEGSAKAKDLYGLQVDTCARVMSLAKANQILMTRFVFDNARQVLKGTDVESLKELKWLNHGPYLVKGVEEPLEICEVGVAGTAPLSPPTSSEKARRHVSDESEPVLGWRPALEQEVPNTKWVLERKLGEGGFGEVWLGRHETLKERRVFKFCFRADRVRSLKREVTLFRVLKERVGHHPNIVGIQEVFFNEPPFYIVMDYAEATDLRAWCEREGFEKIPVATRLEIVAQVADALQAAHEAGVIHRDVKPSNILVSNPKSKIQNPNLEDPQLSTLSPQPSVKLTDFGIGQVVSQEALAGMTRLGFTQTMLSPGSSSQTGTHLYMAPELLDGKPTSTRSDIYSLGVVLYQLLVGDFTHPLTTDWAKRINDPLLREDLEKCFAGNPEERFAEAAQLADNLRSLEKRKAAFVAREKAASRRSTTWKAAAGVFMLVTALFLVGYAIKRARQAALRSEAQESYVTGDGYFMKWTSNDVQRARQYFQKAIRQDPSFAQAYAALALTYLHGFFGDVSPKEGFSIAQKNARRAQELDDGLGEVHTALAQLKFVADWDLSGAEKEFERAVKLNPGYAMVHHLYSHYLMAMGRKEESLREAELYLKIDTLSAMANVHLGWAYLMNRQYDDAIKQGMKTLQMEPNHIPPYYHLCRAYLLRGSYPEAIEALRKAIILSPTDLQFKAMLGQAYALTDQREEAQNILNDLVEARKHTFVDSYYIGLTCLVLDQKDEAIKWLQQAWKERSSDSLGIIYIKVDPFLDSLRSDPQFIALLQEMGLEK